MSPAFEIQLIAVLISIACALPGVFLVLRNMSMMSDSITHTILLGIVLAFFATGDLSSPLLLIGATIMGVITVWLTELLGKSNLLSEESAIGIVFPLLFSIAIILITRYAGSIHLDTDSVLLGELAFAPFDRLVVFGSDIGAKGIYIAAFLLIINLVLIILFFKELKLATFDPILAAVLGLSPVLLHYGLMTLVSFTAVGAFESVGSILVVAFMIGPPVTAYLLTDDLKRMLCYSALFGAAGGILGYQLAMALDVSIAGSIAVMIGLLFLLTFIFSGKQGLIVMVYRRQKQRTQFRAMMILLYLYTHALALDYIATDWESTKKALGWSKKEFKKPMRWLLREGLITAHDELLIVTDTGVERSIAFQKELLH